jgi:hypothetical protein
MAQLQAEGKMGPEYGRLGGRPRKPRASEIVAEEAREHADEIVQALKDALAAGQPVSTRLQAAEKWLAAERKEAELQTREPPRDGIEDLSREQLIDLLAPVLARLQAAGRIPSPQEIIDGAQVKELS